MAKALVAIICVAGSPGIINFLPPGKPDDEAVSIEFDDKGRAEVDSDVADALIQNIPGFKREDDTPKSEEGQAPKPRTPRKKKPDEGGEPSGDGEGEEPDETGGEG